MKKQMVGSWQISGLTTPLQLAAFADAYLDSALRLCKVLKISSRKSSYPRGAVVLSLTFHAVELFLKAAILQNSPEEKLDHDVERLKKSYQNFYPDKKYTLDIPFKTEYVGSGKKTPCKQDQILRYPINKEGETWDGVFAFDPVSFLTEIVQLQFDFKRLQQEIFGQINPADRKNLNYSRPKNIYMKELSATKKILSIIDKEVDGIEAIETTNKNRLSGRLFDIVHEHANSIVILLEHKRDASAYALCRPLFESFVRAAWIQHCANDDDVELILNKDEFKFYKMLEAVEKKLDWGNTLTSIKNIAYKSMNSFTHGGLQIIARRFKDSYIEHNRNEDEVKELLNFIALLSLLSFSQIVQINGVNSKNDILCALEKSIYNLFEMENQNDNIGN